MVRSAQLVPRPQLALHLAAAGAPGAAILAIGLLAPMEETMGHTQRILYVHVSVAWIGLASLMAMACTGIMYLVRRDLSWDDSSAAAAEVGWLSCGLTLLTGSIWAHEAWGSWWTWDPRLTSMLVLWTIYSGCLIVRAGVEDRHRRARFTAVLGVLATADLPLILLATRWFRGIHPAAPAMEPAMRAVLLLSVVGFSAFFFLLFVLRRTQLRLEGRLGALENDGSVDGCGASTDGEGRLPIPENGRSL